MVTAETNKFCISRFGYLFMENVDNKKVWMCKQYSDGKHFLTLLQLICAGASSGIGREVALECARRGAKVILGCRNVNKAETVSAYIRTKTGNDDIHCVIVDLACLSSVRQLVEVCCRRQWTVDILINNAGLFCFNLLYHSLSAALPECNANVCRFVCLYVSPSLSLSLSLSVCRLAYTPAIPRAAILFL